MIKAAVLGALLATPAIAGGPACEDMVGETDPGMRVIGAIGACVNAVSDPAMMAETLTAAGWQEFDEYDGSRSFHAGPDGLMFAADAGFCMFTTETLNTAAMTSFLTAMDMAPVGTDADGCSQFSIEGTTANLTGGRNDPFCTSATEAALRFEPSS